MNLIFTMSISGSIAFILYLIMKPIFNRYCTARWQYRFLKVCLLLYLIPYQCLKDQYYMFCKTLFGYRNPAKENLHTFKSWNTIYITTDGKLHYAYVVPVLVVAVIWLISVSVILYRRIREYRSCRSQWMLFSEASDPEIYAQQASGDIPPAVTSRQAKERILFMTRPKCKTIYSKVITALLVGVIALSMPLSVLAYQPLSVYWDKQDYKPNADVMYIIFDDQPCPLDDPYEANIDFSLSDDIIIDGDGNLHIITGDNTQAARSCSHEYISGQHRHHVRNGSGCTTYIYEGTYCKKCNYCLRETLIGQNTLLNCPH